MRDSSKNGGNGYIIRACSDEGEGFIKNALHVEMDTKNWIYDDDESAARAARRDGLKLVCGIPYVTNNIYVDTPENRKILIAYSRKIASALRRRKRHTAGQASE